MAPDSYREMVIALVRERLKNCPWFNEVSTDYIDDCYHNKDSVERAAEIVEADTRFWDNLGKE